MKSPRLRLEGLLVVASSSFLAFLLGAWFRSLLPDSFHTDYSVIQTAALVSIVFGVLFLVLGFEAIQKLFSKQNHLVYWALISGLAVASGSIVALILQHIGYLDVSFSRLFLFFSMALAFLMPMLLYKPAKMLAGLFNWLLKKINQLDVLDLVYRGVASSYFPLVDDLDAENKKINIARVLIGLIALFRTLFMLLVSVYYYPPLSLSNGVEIWPYQTWLCIAMCILWLLFTLGAATPLTTLLILLTYNTFDRQLGTATLGTNVLTGVMLFFFFANAGQVYSLDSKQLQKTARGAWSKAIQWLYSLLGQPTIRDLSIYRFFLFGAYALISFGAIQHHFNDSYWMLGKTVEVLTTNTYLSRFPLLFRSIQAAFPVLFYAFSIFSGIFQSIYQLFMLPLLWVRWGKAFVILWGLGFFAISLFVLQLSYLPFIELVLWGLCFLHVNVQNRIQILYDDYCNLCRRTVLVLRALNFVPVFEFFPLSKSEEFIHQHGLSFDAVQENIHAVKGEEIYVGYDFYKAITRSHPLLWLLYPLFVFGDITGLGPRTYKYIAQRRRELFGVCEVSFDANVAKQAYQAKPQHRAISSFYVGATLVLWLLFSISFPWSKGIADQLPQRLYSGMLFYNVGLVVPDVFNVVDLSMGDHWFLVYEVQDDGSRRRLLLNAPDGQREVLHLSDVLYFGNSLQWRRGMRSGDVIAKNQPGEFGFVLISRVVQYAFDSHKYTEPKVYQIEIYENSASDITIMDPIARYAARFVTSFDLLVSPEGIQPLD